MSWSITNTSCVGPLVRHLLLGAGTLTGECWGCGGPVDQGEYCELCPSQHPADPADAGPRRHGPVDNTGNVSVPERDFGILRQSCQRRYATLTVERPSDVAQEYVQASCSSRRGQAVKTIILSPGRG